MSWGTVIRVIRGVFTPSDTGRSDCTSCHESDGGRTHGPDGSLPLDIDHSGNSGHPDLTQDTDRDGNRPSGPTR